MAVLARDNPGIIAAMAKIELSIAQRKEHRAQAHYLDPVVIIGSDGLSEGVSKEIALALDCHGLIKVRVASADRVQREAVYAQLCDTLSAAPIQHIGKLLVLWREPIEKVKSATERTDDRMAGPKDVKTLKYSSRGGQRPEVRVIRVLGNQRLTKGGILKNAKTKQKSAKKRAQG